MLGNKNQTFLQRRRPVASLDEISAAMQTCACEKCMLPARRLSSFTAVMTVCCAAHSSTDLPPSRNWNNLTVAAEKLIKISFHLSHTSFMAFFLSDKHRLNMPFTSTLRPISCFLWAWPNDKRISNLHVLMVFKGWILWLKYWNNMILFQILYLVELIEYYFIFSNVHPNSVLFFVLLITGDFVRIVPFWSLKFKMLIIHSCLFHYITLSGSKCLIFCFFLSHHLSFNTFYLSLCFIFLFLFCFMSLNYQRKT